MEKRLGKGYKSLVLIQGAILVCIIAITSMFISFSAVASPSCEPEAGLCTSNDLLSIDKTLSSIVVPSVVTPSWMKSHITFNYTVQTRGTITADLTEFKTQVNETLNDARGWSQLNIRFNEVASGGNFTIYLAQSSQMTTFSANGCGTTYSCTVGNSVIINQDRWLGATDSWNNANGSLRDYRNMVVNHELGHWLGHGHQTCGGPGQLAPVMAQQSIDLQGCKFNPWPLASELWSSRI